MHSPSGLPRIKALPRTLFDFAAGAVTLVLFAFAAAVLWLRYAAFPYIDSYRDLVVSSIEQASGMQVSVGQLSGGWGGLRPVLQLRGLRIADRHGKAAFQIERAELQLAWWALFTGQVRFADVDFYRPELHLRRGADGLIYLADKPLNAASADDDGSFTAWLLAQPSLGIHDATLTWADEKVGAPEVRLTNVQIELRKDLAHHRAALIATPPAELAGRIDLRADVVLERVGTRWKARGQVYAEARDTDLGRLRTHLPLPETLRSGVGSVRTWTLFSSDGVSELVADLAMRDARVQLAADAPPLELAAISGRARYRAQATGFNVTTEGLRFRLPSGDEARPANFSLARIAEAGKPPRGEVRADGIDLKIVASLVDYLPVPADFKGKALQFAPRGRLTEALVSWSGDAAAPVAHYSVHGRFQDLAVNAVDRYPGVSGMSGQVDGTEAGGEVRIGMRNGAFDLPQVFEAPLHLDRLDAHARWKHAGAAVELAFDEVRFANADAEGTCTGVWRSLPNAKQPSPGYLDLKGRLTRAKATSVAHYLPNRTAPVRDWLERSIRAGDSPRATFELRGDLFEFPFGGDSKGHFLVEADLRGGSLRYHPEWPGVDAIDGTLRLENRRLEIRARNAAIFASRAKDVSAVIEDLAVRPALLTLDGEVDTTGADSARFLRESPLVNGPGAFTRAVAVEGPGRLRLHLEYPLAAGQAVRVQGEYEFAGAMATGPLSLVLRDLHGHLGFTERGVRAQDLTGTLFGHPARVALAMQPDGQVLTTLEGRVGAPALADYVPAAIAGRFEGQAAWTARLVSGKQGQDLTISTDLQGMAVTLPAPLAKPADEARALSINVTRLGSGNELVAGTLEGGVHGRFAHVGEQWRAALRFGEPIAATEPAREGLWLYGELPALDVDAWQRVMAAPADTATKPPSAAVELRGVDLRLGRGRYLGREFTNMHAQLARSAEGWSGRLDSPLIAGDVQWSPQDRGRLVARLARLAIPESAPGPTPVRVPNTAAQPDLPAIDLAAERFDFRGRTLGRLDLKAEPAGDEWHIDRLDITSDHAHLASHGGYRRAAGGPITTLAVDLEARSLSRLLGQFGYGDYMKRGVGSLEGTLAWPGLPHEFAVANLAGSFKVKAEKGQFARIEPGAGKLLGLLSLQSLPRRASFDFRDVFSEGFAFDRIQADVKLAHGILLTDDFEISGPSAFVSLAGEVSLPDETQSLTMRVVPEVSEGMALAATVFGTPVLGLSTLLVTKLLRNPIGNAVAFEYQVTGSWDNPHVQRTPAAPLRATPAGSEGAAKASVP